MYPPPKKKNKLTWLAGKSTMNEDVFPIENGDFPVSHVSFQGWYIWGVEWFPHFPQRLPLIPETSRCLHRLFWRSSTQRGSTQRHKHQPTYQLAIRRWWRPWQDLQKPLELEATHILSHTYCTVCTCIYKYIYIYTHYVHHLHITDIKKNIETLDLLQYLSLPNRKLDPETEGWGTDGEQQGFVVGEIMEDGQAPLGVDQRCWASNPHPSG